MFDSSPFNPPVVPPSGPSIPAPVPLLSLSAFANLGSNNSGESTASSLQLRMAAPAPLQSHFVSFIASHGPPPQLETEPQLSSRAAEASSDITGLPLASLRDSVWSQEEDKREVNHRHHLSPPQVIHNVGARNSPKRSTRKRRMAGQSTRTSGDDNSDMRISSDRESSEWDSLNSGENPDTKGRIKMVKLLNLSVANESEDELLELNLTEYGLSQDTSGGEGGRLRWEMFKQKIQAALSHTPSVPISVLEYSQPAIGSNLDKFNTYLRMRGIKGEVALCEEFGMPSPNLAVYYFANSGAWPDPYEETEVLDEKERGKTSPRKKKKTEQYESIPNGLQRLDVILFSREARTPAKLSGAEDDGGRGSMQAVADLKMRKISLFSNHLEIPDDPDDIKMEEETALELTQNGEKDST
ncbi:hypothetical protein GALMADRAFT_208849 [Galerina marginata CBS 339.88]|uniref:Uncharacterized protein n=1 Tax=Galerina marginata (strain CBS 339.88) TaxID=685588 RepID=A0A067T8R3_GALM3|nr:hypothetical protein GALMADRAFT_208849 [Galerina marginata CBS 339.88]